MMEDPKVASMLPQPQGYKLLVAMPEIEDATESGILKADETKNRESVGSICAFVLKVGPDAYPKEKFPSGPWCKEGDWVILRPYTGTRMLVKGKEFRLVNDDSVEATVEDPRGVTRYE